MRTSRIVLMSSIACCGYLASPALAQDAESVEVSSVEISPGEIIVTARRQSEKVRDVPASITVLTAAAIEQTGMKTASDFVKLTPGVSIVTGTAEYGDTQINIRGLNGARDAENNVALVVDGILKTNTSALNQNQGALEQIEVLKGPQGAIYGRNASAGAIVITTRKPSDRFRAEGKVSYGNNETYSASALVSGPIGDSVGFVLSGDFGKSDGFFRNTFLPSAINTATYPSNSNKATSVDDYKKFDINARLIAQIGESTEIDLKARYGQVKSAAIAFNAAFQIPGLFEISETVDSNLDVNKHIFRFDNNIDPNNDQKTFEASGRFDSDIGFANLTGYVAYSKIENDFYADGTSGAFGFFGAEPTCVVTAAATASVIVQEPFQTVGPFRGSQPYGPSSCDGTQYQRRNQEDISAELRLASNTDGPLSWQIGGYLLHIDRRVCVNLGRDTGQGVVEECFTTNARNPTEGLADDTYKTTVYAAFAALDYSVSDAFKAGFALRYDIEERKVANNVPAAARTRWVGNPLTGFPNGTSTTPANYFLNPGLDPAYNPSGVLAPRSATFQQLEPKVTLSYKPSSSTTLFTNWGIGFKSGGFNASGSQAVIEGFFNNGTALFAPLPINAGLNITDDYKKETSSAFEVGIKGGIANNRITYELAGYYTTVKDMQFFEFFVGPFGLLRVVSNIDKVELYGAEASLNVRVVDGWTVFGSANVTNSEIKKNTARSYTVGNKSPYTADYTINLGTQVDVPLGDAIDLALRADYRITGPTFFHTVQDNSVPNLFFGSGLFEGNLKNSQRDAYGVLNLRAALSGNNWSLALFGNNVLNKKYIAEVIPAPEFGGDFISPGARVSYGLELGFKF